MAEDKQVHIEVKVWTGDMVGKLNWSLSQSLGVPWWLLETHIERGEN